MSCPNKNLESWKSLEKVQGVLAYYLWDKYEGNVPKEYYESLENKLINGFLKDFNITATEYEDFKKDVGIDALTASDLITKSIAYQKGESILPEVAYFAYSMLGKNNNKIKSELRYLVSKWDGYKNSFDNHAKTIREKEGFIEDEKLWKNKVKDLVILDFLQENLLNHYKNPQQFKKILDSKWTNEDFNIWNKIIKWIQDLLYNFSIIHKQKKEKLKNIGISIADEILNKNYVYFNYKLKEDQIQKYYSTTIESDLFAKNLVEFVQKKIGLILTGSLALRKAGSVYRTITETLHDIDWVVPFELNNSEKNKEITKLIIESQGSVSDASEKIATSLITQYDWFKQFKEKYPSYKILNSFYGKEHGDYQSLTVQGVVDGKYYDSDGKHEEIVEYYKKDIDLRPIKVKQTIEVLHKKDDWIKDTGYVIDFFIRLKPMQEEHENYFKLWKEIMLAKLKMGRDKDFIDWKMFVPFLKSQDRFNFNYEGFRHINYNSTNENNAFESNEYLQLSNNNTPVNIELNNKINNFLKSIGVSTEYISQIRDKNGNIIDAVAKADILNKIIQIVQNDEDIQTLPEEASHFFVEMLNGNELFKEMFNKITEYKIYSETYNEYKKNPLYRNEDGTINIPKIKKEAIGKLITAHIINNETDTTKIKIIKTWWAKVLDFFRNLFKNISNPFQTSADMILNNDVSLVTDVKSDEEFLKTVRKNPEDSLKKLIEDQNIISTDKTTHIYKVDGKEIINKDKSSRSVTSVVVNPFYEKVFPTDNRTAIKKKIDDIFAETGNIIHEDMQNICERYYDNKTGERKIVPDAITKIKTKKEIYNTLEQYFLELTDQYKGAKVFSEYKIYDRKKNIPGTIDLLIISPDNSVAIYDWKSQKVFYDAVKKQENKELPWYKPIAYRLQLGEYKRILKEEYGFTKFEKVRAIPIKTEFFYKDTPEGLVPTTLAKIEIGNIDVTKIPEEKNYLLPVVLVDESTGNKNLDTLIGKLNYIYDELIKKGFGVEERERKIKEAEDLRNTIRDLQVRKSLKSFVETATNDIQMFNHQYVKKLFTVDNIQFAIERMKLYAEAVNYLSSQAAALTNQIEKLEKTPDSNSEEIKSLKELKFDFLEIIGNANHVKNKLIDRREELGNEYAKKETGITTLLNTQKALTFLDRNINSLSTLNTSALQVFYKILRKAQTKRFNENQKLFRDIESLKKNLEEWGEKHGLKGTDIFNPLLTSDKTRFISKTNPDFYKEKKKALDDDDINWLKKNTIFDEKGYKEGLDSQSKMLLEQYPNNEKKRNAILEKWILNHNAGFKNAYIYKYNKYIKPTKDWWSKEYKFIDENAPLLKTYEYFQDMMLKSARLGMVDFSSRFIPNVEEELSFKKLISDLKVDSSFGFGNIDLLTGELKKEIPVKYLKPVEKKSTDLFTVFGAWGIQMNNYEQMDNLENFSSVLLEIEKGKESYATNWWGKIDFSKQKQNDINAKVLENYINYYLYGQTIDAKNDIAIKIGTTEDGKDNEFSLMNIVTKLKDFMSIKTLALNPLSGTSTFIGATGNAYLQGAKRKIFTEKEWVKGIKDFSSKNEITISAIHQLGLHLENEIYSENKKMSVKDIMNKFSVDNLMFLNKKGDQWGTYPVAATLLNTYMIYKGALVNIREYVKQQNNYDTFYNQSEEKRKEIYNKIEKETEELQKTKSLKATGKVVNDVLEIPGITDNIENHAAFRGIVHKVLKNIIGNATRDDINQIRMTLLGNCLMQFKTWMPQLIKERMGELHYDVDFETWEYGKARLFFKHIMNKEALPLIKELLLGFSDNTYNRAKDRYDEFIERLIKEGKINDPSEFMTESEFIDMYVGNLRSMMRELMMILAFGSLLFVAKGSSDDDDKTGLRKYIKKAMEKYFNEFAFYYSPTEFNQLIGINRSPLPILGLLSETQHLFTHTIGQTWGFVTGNNELEDHSKPLKYLFKILPITKSLEDIYSIFDDDFRKSFDIQ